MTKMKPKTKSEVMKLVKKHKVRYIRLWFTDVLGFLKGFTITIDELPRALGDGMGFDGSSIEGFARIEESDMIARPDISTFAILPWESKEYSVARMFCDRKERRVMTLRQVNDNFVALSFSGVILAQFGAQPPRLDTYC